ncbi:hypothetical protein BGZ83_003457 [Gryganskiella cystojenkinii]|nr:hypothetical protein BGZ83_003457 [Gryganskiella cystojenkinii]
MYMQGVVLSYFYYFKFDSEIPSSLNEREAFVDCTWSFIRGAFTMADIPTRMLEIAINGKKDRKAQFKVRGERQDCARKADRVGFNANQQIYIAESALIYGAIQDKKDEDAWKSTTEARAFCYMQATDEKEDVLAEIAGILLEKKTLEEVLKET